MKDLRDLKDLTIHCRSLCGLTNLVRPGPFLHQNEDHVPHTRQVNLGIVHQPSLVLSFDAQERKAFRADGLGLTVDGWVLNLRTTTLQMCAAVPRWARISGPSTFLSLNSRLESNKEEGLVYGLRV